MSDSSPEDELAALAVIDALRIGLLARIAYVCSGVGGVLGLWAIQRLGLLPVPVGAPLEMLVIGGGVWAVSLVGIWKLDEQERLDELQSRVNDGETAEVSD